MELEEMATNMMGWKNMSVLTYAGINYLEFTNVNLQFWNKKYKSHSLQVMSLKIVQIFLLLHKENMHKVEISSTLLIISRASRKHTALSPTPVNVG